MTIALILAMLAYPAFTFCQAAIGYQRTANKLRAIADLEAKRRQLDRLYWQSSDIEKL